MGVHLTRSAPFTQLPQSHSRLGFLSAYADRTSEFGGVDGHAAFDRIRDPGSRPGLTLQIADVADVADDFELAAHSLAAGSNIKEHKQTRGISRTNRRWQNTNV